LPARPAPGSRFHTRGPLRPRGAGAAVRAGIFTLDFNSIGNGAILNQNYSVNIQPVTVTIGGIPTQVNYAGGAPPAVAGLTQINAVVPENAPTGTTVSVTVQAGNWQSQPGVTMVVE
jgi:hypothetical protein